MAEFLGVFLNFLLDNVGGIVDAIHIVVIVKVIEFLYLLLKCLIYNKEHDNDLFCEKRKYWMGDRMGSTRVLQLISAVKFCIEKISYYVCVLYLYWSIVITFAAIAVFIPDIEVQDIRGMLPFADMQIYTAVGVVA